MDRVDRPKNTGVFFVEMVPPVTTHVTGPTEGDIELSKTLCARVSGLSKTLKRYAVYVLDAVMNFLSADGEPIRDYYDQDPNADTIGSRPPRRHPSGTDAENGCPLCASARTLDSVLDGSSAPASICGEKEALAAADRAGFGDFNHHQQHHCCKAVYALADSDTERSYSQESLLVGVPAPVCVGGDNPPQGPPPPFEPFEPRRTAFPIPIPPRPEPGRRFPLNVSPMEDSPLDCEYCEPYMRGTLPSTPVWPDYYNLIDSYNLYTYMHE